MSGERKTEALNVRMKPGLYRAIRADAMEKGQTLATYIERALQKGLDRAKEKDNQRQPK